MGFLRPAFDWCLILLSASFFVWLFVWARNYEDDNRSERRRYYSGNDVNASSSVVGRYARYDEILEWLNSLCYLYPEIVEIYDIGKTSEGRTMVVLRLGFRRHEAWGVWIDGGIHAREHISPATVIYIADQLIQGYISRDPEVLQMLDRITWYILPVFNPDGYEYSQTKNRLWRKNRRRINKLCVGVDLNRNWDMEWGGADSDTDPCSELYAGTGPSSEAEVRNGANFLKPRASEFIAFLTYHSFGQRIFTRWDYSNLKKPEDHEELTNLAHEMSHAIGRVHETLYRVGQAPKLSYAFGGGSADWAKAVAGIKYSYLIELRDKGYYGFQLPETEILPTGRENWSGVRRLSAHVIEHHPTGNTTAFPRRTPAETSKIDRAFPRNCGNPDASSYRGESETSRGCSVNSGQFLIFRDSCSCLTVVGFLLLLLLLLTVVGNIARS